MFLWELEARYLHQCVLMPSADAPMVERWSDYSCTTAVFEEVRENGLRYSAFFRKEVKYWLSAQCYCDCKLLFGNNCYNGTSLTAPWK